jgi:hypothetical protein
MAERTGGHYFDTGEGPKPIALASGIAVENKVQMAYRAYIEHRPNCGECRDGDTLQCKAADGLWETYREARG